MFNFLKFALELVAEFVCSFVLVKIIISIIQKIRNQKTKPLSKKEKGKLFFEVSLLTLLFGVGIFFYKPRIEVNIKQAYEMIESIIKGSQSPDPTPPPIVPKSASATLFFPHYAVDKPFLLSMAKGDDSHFDTMADEFFTTAEINSMKVYIDSNLYKEAFSLIEEAHSRLIKKGSTLTPDIIESRVNWFVGFTIISAARATNDSSIQHTLLLRASHYFTDALKIFDGDCPAAYSLWIMTLYSVTTGDVVVDRDYFSKNVDVANAKSFAGQSLTCAYSLDLSLTLAQANNDSSTIDAIINNLDTRTDWDDLQSARIYLYMHAADFYISAKMHAKLVIIINLLNKIYLNGIAPANIYRLYLLSLNCPTDGVNVGDLGQISADFFRLKSFVTAASEIPDQKIFSNFDSFDVDVQRRYADEAALNFDNSTKKKVTCP